MSTTAPSSAASAAAVTTLSSAADHSAFLASSTAHPATLHTIEFSASWDEPSLAMQLVLSTLASQHPSHRFALLDAEALQSVTESYAMVESVPTFVFLKAGKIVDFLRGADAAALTQKVAQLSRPPIIVAQPIPVPIPSAAPAAGSASASSSATAAASDLTSRLNALIRQAPVMVFIKGSPSAPRCGFSKQLLSLLSERRVEYQWFDILSDSEVREGLKQLSNWPTYPQLYENGQLVGGLDIVKELIEAGEFPSAASTAAAAAGPQPLRQRLEALLKSSRVLLFMKGDRTAPRCGFSRSAVEILNGVSGLQYATFDILQDDEVRQGLKDYSNWPTYPQLYADGELVGGLDVMKELRDSGELEEQLRGGGEAGEQLHSTAPAQSA